MIFSPVFVLCFLCVFVCFVCFGCFFYDLLEGGVEVFGTTISEVKCEFEFGAWDVGVPRFRGRQLTQMANCEIVIAMEHHKHELQQIEVSKSHRATFERLLSATEMTRYRGGLGSIG